MQDCLSIVIISDSTGETANTYLKSITTQFPKLLYKVIRRPDIINKEEIDEIFKQIPKYSIIVQTIADLNLANYLIEKAQKTGIEVIDILEYGIDTFEKVTGQKAIRQVGLTRALSKDYFNMIEAIEFAIQYDDGKDPRGFLKSDIVLLGVSRTSKTPTTMILATKNFKVSNLPLVPESRLPQELFL